jgi:hypothetical protein
MTQALEQRLRCVDRTARGLVEAQVVVRSDFIQTRSDWETADGVTLREHQFTSANLLDANGESTSLTLSNAPAGNNLYTAHYWVEITPAIPGGGENVHEVQVALEIDAGAGFIEHDRATYGVIRRAGESPRPAVWIHEQLNARVAGIDSTDVLRLRIASVTLPGGASFRVHGYNKTTDADPRVPLTTSGAANLYPAGTANAAPISGVTYHTGVAVDPGDVGVQLADPR